VSGFDPVSNGLEQALGSVTECSSLWLPDFHLLHSLVPELTDSVDCLGEFQALQKGEDGSEGGTGPWVYAQTLQERLWLEFETVCRGKTLVGESSCQTPGK